MNTDPRNHPAAKAAIQEYDTIAGELADVKEQLIRTDAVGDSFTARDLTVRRRDLEARSEGLKNAMIDALTKAAGEIGRDMDRELQPRYERILKHLDAAAREMEEVNEIERDAIHYDFFRHHEAAPVDYKGKSLSINDTRSVWASWGSTLRNYASAIQEAIR